MLQKVKLCEAKHSVNAMIDLPASAVRITTKVMGPFPTMVNATMLKL